jgi:hypothetical protein
LRETPFLPWRRKKTSEDTGQRQGQPEKMSHGRKRLLGAKTG